MFPLFHVVPLEQAEAESTAAKANEFEPAAFVESFWADQLIPAKSNAVDASMLLAAIRDDRAAAKNAHGHSVGLSNSYFYFVTGTGRVVDMQKNTIGLAIEDGVDDVQVSLNIGPIFGNVVRDGTGLLDLNDFSNSRQFNKISTEINERIEADVLPSLREAATIGATIQFTGCAQINDHESDLNPMVVIPFIGESE